MFSKERELGLGSHAAPAEYVSKGKPHTTYRVFASPSSLPLVSFPARPSYGRLLNFFFFDIIPD